MLSVENTLSTELLIRYPVRKMRNQRPMPAETLAVNLRHLMEKKGWSQTEMARQSGVSQKKISNILSQEQQASLATVDKLAAAFNLNLWHMIMPNLPEDLLHSPSIEHLFQYYSSASETGRDYINRVAEREAKYGNLDSGESSGKRAV